MNRTWRNGWLLFLGSLLLLLLVACGPAVERSGDNILSDEPIRVDDGEAEETAAEPAVAVDETSATTDAAGIEVGFTSDGRPYRGDPNAPVVIEEFSDFQCPYCSRFFNQTLPGLEDNYVSQGEVLFIYRDFPLDSIHPQARPAAKAARCAGEQGALAFWGMHDLLFANPQEWSNNNAALTFTQYAGELELDVTQFNACLADNDYDVAIDADIQDGAGRGVRGTPAFFVNGRLLSGAQPLAAFDQVIAQAKSGETVVDSGSSGAASIPDPTNVQVPPPAELSDEIAASLGEADAPVTIIEFTDYQCPFCARHASQTMPLIREQMIATGMVRYILKDLPLDTIHPDAREAAVAARCAGEQDAYWEMHDALFATQAEWAAEGGDTTAALTDVAADIGLDTGAFNSCLTSGRHDAAVQANADEALSLGVSGTPFFFVEGYPLLNGARPYADFEYVVNLAADGELENAIAEAIAAQQLARQQQQQQQPQQPQGPTGIVDVPVGDAFFIGDPDAPVTIVEYTDYQCPFCNRHFQETFPLILKDYVESGQVRYVFKDFPLTNIHPQAVLAAEAARCAGDQDAYIPMHDSLFSKQQEWANNQSAGELFVGYAQSLGLDSSVFSQCLEDHKYEEAVMADYNEAVAFGLTGTPSFFINGRFVNGAQPYAVFEDVIQTALSAE